jgi:hypothetical protein
VTSPPCGPTGITFVAPSLRKTPVPLSATCITLLAKSQAGWSMTCHAAVMFVAAV